MRSFLACLSVAICLTGTNAAGAGRAFTVKSENYVINQFQKINRNLEWDSTNYLVDLSGLYAKCSYTRAQTVAVSQRAPPDETEIVAAVDQTDGSGTDSNSVHGYIVNVINKWIKEKTFHTQIRGATRFGCSVNPGCGEYEDKVTVACLFTPASDDYDVPPADKPDNINKIQALAFTPEQYAIAELITGNKWDRSHFLENLSGFETDCGMIGEREWAFTKSHAMVSGLGLRISNTFGYSENVGSTPDALEIILKKFKELRSVKKVGCSVIPDCLYNKRLYVVVSCIYEE